MSDLNVTVDGISGNAKALPMATTVVVGQRHEHAVVPFEENPEEGSFCKPFNVRDNLTLSG
ncbi:hypothetical protein OS493_020907 [Desmophyllum pertusum]|uniref:Uncharacterized protein n=1 Tax=Desmophyllum pertusum TaxID=174260 RepID=A0A9X0A006_9CNID|nr:hypothetical protein OS493_020907 [Desmophyllum pertusum]